jgi:L-aspartate oxidase
VQSILVDKLAVPFSRKGDGYDMAQEGGHSRRRVLNVRDMTGRAIQERFGDCLQRFDNLTVLYQHTAIDLLAYPHHSLNPARIYREPKVIGAYVLDQRTKKVFRIFARKVVLASGGLSSLFLHSTNPDDAVGSGIAMAHRAGARLANLEFVQFHPTSLYTREGDSFLISEAVRGEGARLMNRKGEYFMDKYSPQKDLAPRDEVARAIYEEMIKNGDDYVLLDLASFAKINIRERFPTIFETCLKHDINILERPIPVVPAAHYGCGGVLVDLNGRTSLRNLYAVGEVSATGVHGANQIGRAHV